MNTDQMETNQINEEQLEYIKNEIKMTYHYREGILHCANLIDAGGL